jgi:protein-disulfide isomerase
MTAMNTKRIIFWVIFLVILGLIVWGLSVAMNKQQGGVPKLGSPSPVTADDHVRGPADAPVTIIEYSDFQCPACAAYNPLVEKLISESTSTVRFVYRHFPLYPLPHKNAVVAAQAAEAAGMQGKFWDMGRLLFVNQLAWEASDKPESIFEEYAQRIGLDVALYKKDFAADATKAHVQRDRDEGDILGINATPTFFVNGKAIVNPNGYEAFKALVDAAARGGAQ